MAANDSSQAWTQASEEFPRLKCYRPLNVDAKEIRLLMITRSDPIEIQIVHGALGKKESPGHLLACLQIKHQNLAPRGYCALSYCWGEAKDMTAIYVEGEKVLIRRQIWECLFSLSKMCNVGNVRGHMPSPPLYVWLDVLCINQEDIPERNSQVAMMHEIYSQAGIVCAYLGPQTHTSNLFCQHVNYHTSYAYAEGDVFGMMDNAGARDNMFTSQSELTSNVPSWVKGLEDITLRPYFSRLWIIQEIVFSRRLFIVIGNAFIPWSIFVQAQQRVPAGISRLSVYSGFDKKLRAIDFLRPGIHLGTTRMPLLDLFEWFLDNKCRDPRDTMYALYGMANDVEGLSVDYSIPPNKLWWTIFQHYLNSSRRTVGVFDQDKILELLGKFLVKSNSSNSQHWDNLTQDDFPGYAELAVYSLGRLRLYKDLCFRASYIRNQSHDDVKKMQQRSFWEVVSATETEVLNFTWAEKRDKVVGKSRFLLTNCHVEDNDCIMRIAAHALCMFIVGETSDGELKIKGQAWNCPSALEFGHRPDPASMLLRDFLDALPTRMHYELQSSLANLDSSDQLGNLLKLKNAGKHYEVGLGQPYVRVSAAAAMALYVSDVFPDIMKSLQPSDAAGDN